MYTVTGTTREGVAYGVTVGGEQTPEPDAGIVTGSPIVLDLLRFAEGTEVEATPTGPVTTVDLKDEASVLIALMGLTNVQETDGEVPRVHEAPPHGAVY